MSLSEAMYEALAEDERRMWQRAASVAQDERRTPIEHALALDVTRALCVISGMRGVLAVDLEPTKVGGGETDGVA